MATTPCGIDTSIEAIKNSQGDLDALFGPGAKDKFAEIEAKSETLSTKLEAKLQPIVENPNLQKSLQSLQGKSPFEALSSLTEIQKEFGPVVDDLQAVLEDESPDLASIAGEVEGVLGTGGGSIGDLQQSLSTGGFAELLGKASKISNEINVDDICAKCKNIEIQTLPDGTKTSVELPKEPKIPEIAPSIAIPSISMSGSDSFKTSILVSRKQLFVNSHRPFAKYYTETGNKLKKYYIDNEWETESYNSEDYGTILTSDLQAVDLSIDPFDPANSNKLNGITPQQYKNTQIAKSVYAKKYKIAVRQWIIDKHEIANAIEEIVPYDEYFELAESIISEDEIDTDPPVKFRGRFGLPSIHAIRDATKSGYDAAYYQNLGAYMSFNYYIYNKVRVDNGLDVDTAGL